MYFVIVVLLLLVLPAASVILEAVQAPHAASTMALVGKLYVFWACGEGCWEFMPDLIRKFSRKHYHASANQDSRR